MASRDRQVLNDRSPLLGAVGGTNSRTANTGDAEYVGGRADLPLWRHILENKMTWACYNVVLSSGAVSLLLYHLPYRVHRLWILGATIYILTLALFLITLITHAVRFLVRPALLRASFVHPSEGEHISTLPAALVMLLINAATYSDELRQTNHGALCAFFWISATLAAVFALVSPLTRFAACVELPRDAHSGLPLLSALPLLLLGPAAGAVLVRLPAPHDGCAMAILAVGTTLHGLGAVLALFHMQVLFSRLLSDGFPRASARPSLFLASVPAALTSWGATSLGLQALHRLPAAAAGPALYYGGVIVGLVGWALAVWWFVVAVVGLLASIADVGPVSMQIGFFQVVLAHATLFLAQSELLGVMGRQTVLNSVNEVLGVATTAVWVLVVFAGVYGIGRAVRD